MPVDVVVAAGLLAAADWGYERVGNSFFPGGPLDELAHALTTLLVLWALGRRVRERFLAWALAASVAIDADHIPDRLGVHWLTAGTPRPYTHSLLTIAVVLLGAALVRRGRDPLLAIALGLALHFFRDLGEVGSGVSLFWPVSYRPLSISHGVYLGVMAAVVLADLIKVSRAAGFAAPTSK